MNNPKAQLSSLLDRLSRHMSRVAMVVGGMWGFAALLLAIGLVVWLDLMWELSPEARQSGLRAAPWALVAVVGGIILLARRWRRGDALARRLDSVGETGGRILSGYDLAQAEPSGSEMTDGLAQIAVQDAAQLAGRIPTEQIIPPRQIFRPLATIGGLLFAVLVLTLAAPQLMRTQWLRMWDPHGDHPPYSGVTFTIEPQHASVMYGEPMDVYATVDGAHDDRMELVLLASGESGDSPLVEPQVLPMFLEPDQRWRAAVANLTEPYTYFVRAGRARSHRYELEVVTVPQIESVTFRVTPPKYTGLEAYEGPLPRGGLRGLPGTKVSVTAVSNRPLSDGELELKFDNGAEDSVLMTNTKDSSQDNFNRVVCNFTLTRSGSFRFMVADRDNPELTSDAFTAAIAVTKDEPPLVRLLSPRENSLATPSVRLPVVVQAEDDYGVANVQFYRSLNGARPLPVKVSLTDPPETALRSEFELPLYDYGLQPGDEIKLFARATDTNPLGPGGAESGVATVRIISDAEFRAAVRQREGIAQLMNKYRQARRRLENLKAATERLQQELAELSESSDADDEPLGDEAREKLAELQQQIADQQQAIEQLARDEMPYDIDRELSKTLAEMAKRLGEYAKDLESTSGGKEGVSPQQKPAKEALEALLANLEKELGDFDRQAMEPLEYLDQVYPLMEDMMRFVALAGRQKSLADRLQTYKDTLSVEDSAERRRMRDLEDEQHGLRDALAELLKDIEEHAMQLPESEELAELRQSAIEFVDRVQVSGAFDAMEGAELALGGFEGMDAYYAALDAADILASFIKECSGMAGKCEGACKLRFQPSIGGGGLGNTLSQLLAQMGGRPGMGNGFGLGAGGGSSAMSGPQQRMGLYGNLPTYDMARQSSGASGDGRAGGRGGPSRGGDRSRSTWLAPPTSTEASGSAAAQAPIEYRERVGDYMRRLAKELDE